MDIVGKNSPVLRSLSNGPFSRIREETNSNVLPLLSCEDWFLANISKSSKYNVGEYVRGEGFRVPKTHVIENGPGWYDRISEFFYVNNQGLIFRSECKQDYDGLSGLLSSKKYTKHLNIGDFCKFKSRFSVKQFSENIKKIMKYTRSYEKNLDEFRKGIDFSIWEYIEGENLSIIEDSAVKGRYHILINGFYGNYIHFENGTVIYRSDTHLLFTEKEFSKKLIINSEIIDRIEELVNMYEGIRNLKKFDSKHCPIMEFQFGKGGEEEVEQFYFLQYHRTRITEEAKFEIDAGYELELCELGYVKANFVRGVTEKGGEKFQTKVLSSERGEDYGREVLSRESEILLLEGGQDILWHMKDGVHASLSELTKPGITIYMEGLIVGQDLQIKVISDGKKCYVKFL